MQRRRLPRAWTDALIAIALLVIGTPLAMAAMNGVSMLIPRAPEPGYLLYPRSNLCAPRRPRAEEAAVAIRVHRSTVFRAAPKADAVMPPGLGERLNPEQLEALPSRTAKE
jgi:hypothetical protein